MQLGCIMGEATTWSCVQQGHAPRNRDADSEAGTLVSMDTLVRAILSLTPLTGSRALVGFSQEESLGV